MRLALAMLTLCALALAGAATAPGTPRATKLSTGATFVLTGHGWGHGVGLSQCGAIGYGKRGWTAARIVRHYYTGTQLADAPVARVRVLIADGRRSLRISSDAPFKVKDGSGKTWPLPGKTVDLTTALKVKVEAGKPARALPGPLTFLPTKSTLVLEKPYRGQFVVKVVSGGLRAVNSVPLEQYLYGVVPLEIGSTGPAEALKAQAIAARSYALATRGSGDFDLYADTRSQVYGGAAAEQPETNDAVDATAGRVLTFKGKVIPAYYFASSGGRTASVQDAWPSSRPVSYLVSVDDPYDNVCSEHSWGPYVFSASGLAGKLGLGSRVVDARTVVNPSKRVTTLQVRTAAGRSSLAGSAVRSTMGLRSTWFRIGVLSLSRGAGTVVYGGAVQLSGIARGLGPAFLDQRLPGKAWGKAVRVKPAGDGTFAVRVKPKRTLEYRLRAAKVSSSAVRVPVAPNIRIEENGPAELVGSVQPAFADARVDVQRQGGGGWTTVTSVRTDETGGFVAELPEASGNYRARIAARSGYAAGVSPALRVDV